MNHNDPPNPSSLGIQGAKAAGLRYIAHLDKGIHRRRRGTRFLYLYDSGKPVRDRRTLARIKALVIPPAWENVCICSDPRGHIQAVGRDQRGRKQYLYHPTWRQTRDENKYERMLDFGRVLPKIRRKVRRDLRQPGLPREKILATIVQLLQTTFIRIGNQEYARQNHSFGLTTMRNRHVHVNGDAIHFDFRGKSGVEHVVDLENQRLAKIVRACQHLPGQELFQYLDPDGDRHSIASEDVNEYLHSIAGNGFTAKDFRTWAGTVLAAAALRQCGIFNSKNQAKKNTLTAIASVAKELGNTKGVCRKCYIHPTIFTAYLEGTLLKCLQQKNHAPPGLHADEAAVLVLLRQKPAPNSNSTNKNPRATTRRKISRARR